jgi:hypothetical protein
MEEYLLTEEQLTQLRQLQAALADSSPMPYDSRAAIAEQLRTLLNAIADQIVPESIEHGPEDEQKP